MPKQMPKRRAQYVATLVYADEPQVIHLMSVTVPIVAVAIPSEDPDQSLFLAATASKSDWTDYLNGASDLRYLFTYPTTRLIYTFDLNDMRDGRVALDRLGGDAIPEAWLPAPQFFSRYHTEEFNTATVPTKTETLLVDGDWELQEFGNFYQRYSDVYAFLVALMNWQDQTVALPIKDKIKGAFAGKPFEGGGSYLHFFSDLFSVLRPGERLGLDKVKYASPGFVDVNGRDEAFSQVEANVGAVLAAHSTLRKEYTELRSYLSKAGLLTLAGHNFPADHPQSDAVGRKAKAFAENLGLPNYDLILSLANDNTLVAAKIVLSYYRRIEEASGYFAQGRVAFS